MNSVLRRKVRRLVKNSSVWVLIVVGMFYVVTVNALYAKAPEQVQAQEVTIAEEVPPLPTQLCVWGKNDDGSCLDPDPCVYSNVQCSAETLKENRKLTIQDMIRAAAREYGVDEELALRVADCESGFDEFASNDHSTAKGLYQFLDGTWADIKAQGHQYDAEENIKNFMIWYQIYPGWWECK